MATTVANGNSEHLSVAITTVASTRSFAKSIATSNIGRLTAPQSVSTNLGFTSRLATLSSSGQEENNRHSQEAKVLFFLVFKSGVYIHFFPCWNFF